MSLDPLISVDVSGLETKSQKAAVRQSFLDLGWSDVDIQVSGHEPLTGKPIVSEYRFMWERIGEPVYPQLPSVCVLCKIH